MRREIFTEVRGKGLKLNSGVHIIFIAILTIVAVISFFATYSCEGVTFIDHPEEIGKGVLNLKFGKDLVTKSSGRTFPDSNLFTLTIKRVGGATIYSGKYGERPGSMELDAGSYDVAVFSSVFTVPEFDAPCYSDSRTVVVEQDKVTNLVFDCRQSNGAMRLTFSPEFINRFSNRVVEIWDAAGFRQYPYTETRFLYLNPGEISLRIRQLSSDDTIGILLTRRTLLAREMVTINLHSSSGEPSSGSGEATAKIVIDTSAVWISENIEIGDFNDGSTKERALRPDELAGYEGAKGVWVYGYISGYLTTSALKCTPPFDVETNVAISPNEWETEKNNCAGIALPAGAIREAVNLKSNPANLGKLLYVKGTVTASYFGLRGLNSLTEYVIE